MDSGDAKKRRREWEKSAMNANAEIFESPEPEVTARAYAPVNASRSVRIGVDEAHGDQV